MKKLAIWALALCAAAAATAGSYRNPVIPGFYPDPSVCRVDSDFYLVNSSFQFFPGVPVWHSRDLVNWEQIGNVLDRPSQLPLGQASAWLGIYAPTIRYNDGTFYMITTNVGPQASGSGNFMVTATNPAGPWSEPIALEQGGIDPSLYFEDGRAYMTSNPDNTIFLCEIDPATGKQLTPSRAIWQGTGGRYPEAPHIYKKDGWYYLLIAEGGTELGHGATIARSRDIYGPYTPAPHNPVLSNFRMAAQGSKIQGVGHADLVDAPDGSWWIVALGYRTMGNGCHTLGRETMLAPVRWDEGAWPVVNADGTLDTLMTTPAMLPAAPVEKPAARTDFTKTRTPGHHWVYLRNPRMENYTLDRRGLKLKGTAVTLDDGDSPTWTGVRQTEHDFAAATTMSLDRHAPAGSEAGITVYMDGGSHYDLAVRSLGDGRQEAVCTLRLQAVTHSFEPIALRAGERVVLRVEGEPDMYSFSISTDGGRSFIPAGRANARYLSTETAGGFTGMTIGLFAVGEGAEATFTDFTYTTL